MMQSTIALGYNAYLMKKLHPGPVTDNLFTCTNTLVSSINAFILENIMKMRSIADEPSSEPDASDFAKRLNDGCEKRIKQIRDLEGRMARLHISERAFSVFGIGSMVQELPMLNTIFRLSRHD
jgi:hypothetical protein